MADDLDKFVLQYQVELKDSIKKLEDLQKKMSGVGTEHAKAQSKIKDFAADATQELSKLVPGIDAVGRSIRFMGAGFSAAAVGVAALAVSVKAVLKLRQEFESQRLMGIDLGVSGLRVEEYQRKFAGVKSVNIGREQNADFMKQFRQMASAAYANPGGVEARRLRALGVNAGVVGGTPTGFNTMMGQLGTKLGGMSTEQVQALAYATGMSEDWLRAVKELGPNIGKVTEHTNAEIAARKKAEDEVKKLNDNIKAFEEASHKLWQELGKLTVGPMTEFVKLVTKLTEKLNGVGDRYKSAEERVNQEKGEGIFGGKSMSQKLQILKEAFFGKSKETKEFEEKKLAQETKTADEQVEALDADRVKAKAEGDRMKAIIDQFGGAVSTFSSAVDTQQAWAAWAGEIGRAGGHGGGRYTPNGSGGSGSVTPSSSGSSRGVATVRAGTTAYDDIINEAAAKYGVDPGLIKNVISAESAFNPKAVSSAGAVGLMQIMPFHNKKFGITDATDPRQNIMAGTAILAQNIKRFGNVDDALRAYNGGWDPKRWGNKETAAYVGRVHSQGFGGSGGRKIAGQSRQDTQMWQVQANIASHLGVPLQQIQQGGVNRGDVEYSVGRLTEGYKNTIFKLKNENASKIMGAQEKEKLLNEIRNQERGLALMQQYGGRVIEQQKEGPRDITIGDVYVEVHTQSTDAVGIGREMNNQMRGYLVETASQLNTGTKG